MLDLSTMPTPPSRFIGALAAAIDQAENANSSWNNPGALALGDQGYGVGNSAGVTIFPSPQAGWQALFSQLQLVTSGSSSYENMGMTIGTFAMAWTGNENASSWAAAVANSLGVSQMATLSQVEEVYDQAPADPATGLPVVSEASIRLTSSSAGGSLLSWNTIGIVAAVGVGLLLLLPSKR